MCVRASLLEHASNQCIDVLLTVPALAALHVVVELALHAALGALELEGPQKVVGSLEVLPHCNNLVNEVLHAHNALGAQNLLNDGVLREGHALLVELCKPALVNELAHRLEVGEAPCNVGCNQLKHGKGGLVELDKGAIVDLAQAEELKNAADLGGHAIDTTDAHNKGKLGLLLNVKVTLVSGGALGGYKVDLLLLVLCADAGWGV
jgi:hypothetical protein